MLTEEKIREKLNLIYEDHDDAALAFALILERLKRYDRGPEGGCGDDACADGLTQRDTMLITYGDSICREGEFPLHTLHDFLRRYAGDAVGHVHILPMYPYTSDDGFSVVDYRQINPELGTWEEIHELGRDYGLMFDAVINHISRSSSWFQAYLRCEPPYSDYFITCDPDADYSLVTRPRALPLLTKVSTPEGDKYVWTTFSTDQIDLNAACPHVLAELCDLLVFYGRNGARFIRLDAIGFLWKELGTTCMHHEKTHQIIRLFKLLLKEYAPGTRIITETNVPQEDNLSYFGAADEEADLVYQFPLPPLTMYTLLKGDAKILSGWLRTQAPPNGKVTFFNFLSSHDGIGLRPAEDLLDEEQRQFLVDATLRNGGRVSFRNNSDGSVSPYELNINYQDALAGPDESDETRIGRFIAAETILLSLQGMPAVYVHSLLGSRNDYRGMTVSGQPRRINREKLSLSYLEEQLRTETNRSVIFHELVRRLKIRREQSAFSPAAAQSVPDTDRRVLAVYRENAETGQRIMALINVSGEFVRLRMEDVSGTDLLSGETVAADIALSPFQARWIHMVTQ